MKKRILIPNIIIVIMFVSLMVLSFNSANSLSVKADNRVIYSGSAEKNNVCFMINVYQGNQEIYDMLDIFDVYKVKTTFFVGGCWAVNNIELVQEMKNRGHEIGNHGFYHKDQDKLDKKANIEEIDMCHKLIAKNLKLEMNLFAPPSGAYDSLVVDVAESLNYKTIMWTHDTIDWRDQDSDLIFKRATNNLSNGDLILMHPTKKSVETLTRILSFAVNNGYNPTTVTNCL